MEHLVKTDHRDHRTPWGGSERLGCRGCQGQGHGLTWRQTTREPTPMLFENTGEVGSGTGQVNVWSRPTEISAYACSSVVKAGPVVVSYPWAGSKRGGGEMEWAERRLQWW